MKAFSRILLAVVVVSCCQRADAKPIVFRALIADQITFQRFNSAKGRFSVEMPGLPTEQVVNYGTAGAEHNFQVSVNDGGIHVTYSVGYFDLDPQQLEGKDWEGILKRFRTGHRKGGVISADRKIAIGANRIPGRDYLVKTTDGLHLRERLMLDGHRVYWAYVLPFPDKTYLSSKSADRFLESFEISSSSGRTAPNITAPQTQLTFRTFVSKEGRFAVELPGQPRFETLHAGTKSAEQCYTIIANEGRMGIVFRVTYSDLSDTVVSRFDAQLILETACESLHQGHKVRDQKSFFHGKSKLPAHSYALDFPGGIEVRETLFLSGSRLYRTQVAKYANEFERASGNPDSNYFHQSFSVTE